MAALVRRYGRALADVSPQLIDQEVAPGIPSRTLLESLQANVFVADVGLNLVYMNPKATRTLALLGGEVEKAFPTSTGFSGPPVRWSATSSPGRTSVRGSRLRST